MNEFRISALSPMTTEPEDAHLTGHTRNLERRLLALNRTQLGNRIRTSSNWSERTVKAIHGDSTSLVSTSRQSDIRLSQEEICVGFITKP
jgi:hypothetical protein